MAKRAAPVVRHISDNVASATETLHVKTDQLRSTPDTWAASARTNVRSKPLVAAAAAFAIGAVIGRLLRGSEQRNG